MKKLVLWPFALLLLACQPAADHESESAETSPPAAGHTAKPETRAAADTIAAPVAAGTVATPPAAPVTRRYAYQVRPGDDTKGNIALQSFIRRVIGYAKNRQRAALVAVADDSIAISYGGGLFGKKEFSTFLADPQSGGYTQIRQALELGGAKEEEKSGEWAYLFPYCQSQQRWSRVPEGEESDPFRTFIGLVSDLKIYQEPKTESLLLARLAYPILFLDEKNDGFKPGPNWIRLKTVDGKTHGWVDATTVYNEASMTVVITKVAGQYRIVSVAPYD